MIRELSHYRNAQTLIIVHHKCIEILIETSMKAYKSLKICCHPKKPNIPVRVPEYFWYSNMHLEMGSSTMYLPSKNLWKWKKKMYIRSRLGFKCISFWWSEVFLHNRKVFSLMEKEVSGNSLPNLFLCNKGYPTFSHSFTLWSSSLWEVYTASLCASGACDGLRWVWTLWHNKTEGLDFFDSIWMDLCTPLLFFIQLFPDKNTTWQFERTSNITKLVNEGRNWEVEIWLRLLWPSFNLNQSLRYGNP